MAEKDDARITRLAMENLPGVLRYGTWAEEGKKGARLFTHFAVVDIFLLATYFQTEAELALVWQVEHNTSVLDHSILIIFFHHVQVILGVCLFSTPYH